MASQEKAKAPSPTEKAANLAAEAVRGHFDAAVAQQKTDTEGILSRFRTEISQEIQAKVGVIDERFDAYENRLRNTIKNKPYVAATIFLAGVLVGYGLSKLF